MGREPGPRTHRQAMHLGKSRDALEVRRVKAMLSHGLAVQGERDVQGGCSACSARRRNRRVGYVRNSDGDVLLEPRIDGRDVEIFGKLGRGKVVTAPSLGLLLQFAKGYDISGYAQNSSECTASTGSRTCTNEPASPSPRSAVHAVQAAVAGVACRWQKAELRWMSAR